MTQTLHLVVGDSAKGVLRQALALKSDPGEVFGFRDPMDVGPLVDIDGDGQERFKFWSQIGTTRSEWDSRRTAEDEIWSRIASEKAEIVLWRGESAAEVALGLRIASRLGARSSAFFEVVNPIGDPRLSSFSSSIGLQHADELAALINERRPVTDIAARANEWESIRSKPDVYFRDRKDDRWIELPEDGFDDWIAAECSPSWTKINLVIGRVMSAHPCGDWVIAWRVRRMIELGRLEGQGEGPYGPAELRIR